MACPVSPLSFHSSGCERSSSSFPGPWSLQEALQEMVFVITEHLLMACGHRPVGSSPRPRVQSVPGLCLGLSLIGLVTWGSLKASWRLFFLPSNSPGLHFPPVLLGGWGLLQLSVYGAPEQWRPPWGAEAPPGTPP